MTWKKALFFGGAVILLAACDNATAPNALTRVEGAQAAAKAPPQAAAPKTGTAPRPKDNGLGLCSGYVIFSGGDSTGVRICVPEAQ